MELFILIMNLMTLVRKNKYKLFTVLFISYFFNGICISQNKTLVKFNNSKLITKIDNSFEVIGQQIKPIDIAQLEARMVSKNNDTIGLRIVKQKNSFIVHPKLEGILEIRVSIDTNVELHKFQVKKLKLIATIGGNKNLKNSISQSMFIVQQGLVVKGNYYGIEIKKHIDSFRISRISNGMVEKNHNHGNKYSEQSKLLVNKAVSGDYYLFSKIYTHNIDGERVLLDNLFVEIK